MDLLSRTREFLAKRNWEVQHLVARGGMSAVFFAVHSHLGTRAAVKVLLPQFEHEEEQLHRFQQEARICAELAHPRLVRTLDLFIDGTHIYMILEWLEGCTLELRLRHGPLAIKEALLIITDVCDALAYAHRHGILHRDIKPSNIFLSSGGHAKLLDFGIAKLINRAESFTRTGSCVGTPAYMSPEQLDSSSDVGFRSDVYSVGILLYEMLVGSSPFQAHTTATTIFNVCHKKLEPSIYIPRGIFEVLSCATAKSPVERYATIEGFVAALHERQDGGGDRSKPPAVTPRSPPKDPAVSPEPQNPRRGAMSVFVAGVLLFLVFRAADNGVHVALALQKVRGSTVIASCSLLGAALLMVLVIMYPRSAGSPGASCLKSMVCFSLACVLVGALLEAGSYFDAYVLDMPWNYVSSRRTIHAAMVESGWLWVVAGILGAWLRQLAHKRV